MLESILQCTLEGVEGERSASTDGDGGSVGTWLAGGMYEKEGVSGMGWAG